MKSNKQIQFEGYIKSYLKNYLVKNKSKEEFEKGFYGHLLNQMLNISAKTILTLFYTFKRENLLEGNSPEERYDYFDNYSKTDEFHNLVNKIYPLLTIRLDRIIDNHILNYNELIKRIENDKPELFDKLEFSMGNLEDCNIEYGLSDAHRGLNSICIIEKDNKKIVYKPRPGKIERHWGVFIEWFNSKNPSLKLKINKIIDKGDYHWQEYVDNKPCQSELEIRKLYHRIGILASISYILKIEDLHMENIIVNKDLPYLVDLEALFQIDGFQNGNLKAQNATDLLNKKVRQSILSTQLFPTPSKFYDSNIDIAGITGKAGQIIENGKLETINQFTDEIEVIRVDNIIEQKENIGQIGRDLVDPKDYIKEIVEGFQEGYILIQDNKEELLQLISSKGLFKDIYPRYLFRNTNLYGMILDMSKNPRYLKEKSELDRLYNLLVNENEIEKFKDVYKSEVEDLFNDDIPYFYGNINDGSIYNSNGDKCFTVDSTPLEEVSHRIKSLDKEDMNTQTDFIIKAMTNQKKTWNKTREKIDQVTNIGINKKNLLIEAARDIADRLISKAVIDEESETINWLDIQNTFPTWSMGAQDIFLYSGLSGNAVFFSSLYHETKDIKYKNILDKILKTIRLDWDRLKDKPLSAFNGVFSLAYLYAFLYNQTRDEKMLQLSLNIISQYEEEIFNNKSYDIIDGLAGVLLVILNIYELRRDEDLKELSLSIGQDIIKNIQIDDKTAYWRKTGDKQLMIAGFSHGLAGVSYALAKLSRITGYKENLSIIDKLIEIENNYYNEDIKNWIDLRIEDPDPDESPIHWCHGATGIGLSRLGCKDLVDTSDDIAKALEVLREKGLYCDSDSLCHGNLGNMELLLELYEENGDLKLYNEAVSRVSEIIFESKSKKDGYINGIGQEFDSPSFMLGLSGIGYEILRILAPMKYPSLLLLEV